MNTAALGSLFRTIGDTSRLRLLHLLSQQELSVSELVRVVGLPQSTVSRHLKALREEGLVADRPAGPTTYYRATVEAETGNGETALRDSLAELLRSSELSKSDRKTLARVVQERNAGDELFFERIGWRWDALRESCFGPTFHLEAFFALLPNHWTVADLGTGTGYLLPILGRYFERVIAVDNSPAMLELAARRLAEHHLQDRVELLQGDLESLPVEPHSVDLAVAVLMLHHLPNVPAALHEMKRVLKPGGQLLIVDQQEHTNEEFRVQMADRRSGIAPEALNAMVAEAGLTLARILPLPARAHAEPELAPVPELYVAVATTDQKVSEEAGNERETQ